MTCFPRDILRIFAALMFISHSIGSSGAVTPGPPKDWEADESLLVPIDVDNMNGLKCLVVAPEKGSLWIGSENGLYRVRVERGSKEAERILPERPDPNGLAFNVNCLIYWRNILWVGTSEGLYSLDPQKEAVGPKKHCEIEGRVRSLAVSRNTLAIGTAKTLYLWDHEDPKKPALSDQMTTTRDTARNAKIPGQKARILSPVSDRCQMKSSPIDQDASWSVGYLATDRQGRIWAASDKGIYYCERDAQSTWTTKKLRPIGQKKPFIVAHPDDTGLWFQESNKAADFVRLEDPLGKEGPGKAGGPREIRYEAIGYINPIGYINQCLVANCNLWIAAGTNARASSSSPNPGGLFRWRYGDKALSPVILRDRDGNLEARDIMGLSRDGDVLWVAARDGVYRVKGLEEGEWHPKITITAPKPKPKPLLSLSSFFSLPIFAGDPVTIEWNSPTDLAGRTTPENVQFKVLVDGAGVGKDGPNKDGIYSYKFPTTDAKEYRYEIRAIDLSGVEATADRPRSFYAVNPISWWSTRIGLPALLLSVVVVIFLICSVPLQRRALVYFFGYRYSFDLDAYRHKFSVKSRGKGRYSLTYESADPSWPEREVTLGTEWPRQDLAEGIGEQLDALEKTIRGWIDNLNNPDAKPAGQVARLEAEAKESLRLVGQACRRLDQKGGFDQIARSLRSYEEGKATHLDQKGLVAILEECLRGPLFLTSWLDDLRSRMAGDIVIVSADEASFRNPWSQLIGNKWSVGEGAAVAGQVTQAVPAVVKLAQEEVRFAALGCIQAEEGDPLPGAGREAAEVSGIFKKTGARAVPLLGPEASTRASVGHFITALREADIVHVATHASPDIIQFTEGKFLIGDLKSLGPLRCRLLVLSACEAASFDQVGMSLAHEFVSRGVNVLASLDRVDDRFCEAFFPKLYETMLPPRKISGDNLGTAIRKAAGCWRGEASNAGGVDGRHPNGLPMTAPIDSRPEKPRELGVPSQESRCRTAGDSVDTFVLLGNPGLKIRLA